MDNREVLYDAAYDLRSLNNIFKHLTHITTDVEKLILNVDNFDIETAHAELRNIKNRISFTKQMLLNEQEQQVYHMKLLERGKP